MIRRPTLILLILLAVSAALAWYLESSPAGQARKTTPTATEIARLMPDLDEISIKTLSFSSPAGESLTLTGNLQNKFVFAGINDREVDQGQLFQLLSEVTSLRPAGTFEPGLDGNATGLDTPTLVIHIDTLKGTSHTLTIGGETPIGSGYYTVFNDNQAVILEKSAVDRIIELASVDALAAQVASPTP